MTYYALVHSYTSGLSKGVPQKIIFHSLKHAKKHVEDSVFGDDWGEVVGVYFDFIYRKGKWSKTGMKRRNP